MVSFDFVVKQNLDVARLWIKPKNNYISLFLLSILKLIWNNNTYMYVFANNSNVSIASSPSFTSTNDIFWVNRDKKWVTWINKTLPLTFACQTTCLPYTTLSYVAFHNMSCSIYFTGVTYQMDGLHVSGKKNKHGRLISWTVVRFRERERERERGWWG